MERTSYSTSSHAAKFAARTERFLASPGGQQVPQLLSHGCFLRLRQSAEMTRDHRGMNSGQLMQSEHGRDLQIGGTELGSGRVQNQIGRHQRRGKTEEMYATSTSGMGPTGPASTSTGRSFIPAVSPNGKLARLISPGCIYGLAIRQSVKIVPHVAQLVTPGLR
jgi:hypothetical protein